MVYLRCDNCGIIIRSSKIPDFCSGCGLESKAAFPFGSIPDGEQLPTSVENLFDIEPVDATSLPQGRVPARLKDRSQPNATIVPLEVGDEDVVAVEEIHNGNEPDLAILNNNTVVSSTPFASPQIIQISSPPTDNNIKTKQIPNQPQAKGPLLQWTAPEYNKDEVQELTHLKNPKKKSSARQSSNSKISPPPTPVDIKPPLKFGSTEQQSPDPLPGRVAFPITKTNEINTPSSFPPGIDKLAVAGDPPLPPDQNQVLIPQTASLPLKKTNNSQRFNFILGFSLGGITFVVLSALGAYYVLFRGSEPTQPPIVIKTLNPLPDIGIVDLHSPPPQPDSSIIDSSPPDLAVLGFKKIDKGRAPHRVRTSAYVPKQKDTNPSETHALNMDVSTPAREEAQNFYQEGLQNLIRGDSHAAVRLFNAALAKNPRASLCYRGLGLAYEKLGSKAMARAAFNRYLILRPAAGDAEAIRKRIEDLQ